MNFLSTGEKIKRARIYRGITLKELCQKDISISRMSCIENGKVVPDRWVLELVAKRLNLDLDYLLCDDVSEIKRNIKKYSLKNDKLRESECIEITDNIKYAVSKGYYDLGVELIHILFEFYINNRKFYRMHKVLNDYDAIHEHNESCSKIYYRDLSKYFIITEHYKDAITWLEKLEEYSKEDKNIDEKIEIGISKAYCYYKTGDLKTAEKIITPFYALSKSRDNEVLFSIVNGILAILALEYDENYQEYLKVLDENGAKEDYYYNKLKMIIVKLLISKGSKEEAKQHIDDLENNITKENLSKYVDTLLMLSEILIDDKNYEKATDYTDKALQVAIELDNIVFIENSYYLKGKIAKYQGSFIQWEMYMNLAIDLLLKFGSYSQKNDRYLEMENMYHVIGETREALKYLTMAAESEKELY